jgi:hypothetical protein
MIKLIRIIFSIIISIVLIIGGLGGGLVLRGTESSEALAIAGTIWLLYAIIQLVIYIKAYKYNSDDPDDIITLIPPGSHDKVCCNFDQSLLIESFQEIINQGWESIIPDKYCDVRYFLAILQKKQPQELLTKINEREATFADYGIEKEAQLYIIKEHTLSDTCQIRLSIITNNTFSIEIFDNTKAKICSIELEWFLFQKSQNNEKFLLLYVLDGAGISLIKGTNYEIIFPQKLNDVQLYEEYRGSNQNMKPLLEFEIEKRDYNVKEFCKAQHNRCGKSANFSIPVVAFSICILAELLSFFIDLPDRVKWIMEAFSTLVFIFSCIYIFTAAELLKNNKTIWKYNKVSRDRAIILLISFIAILIIVMYLYIR